MDRKSETVVGYAAVLSGFTLTVLILQTLTHAAQLLTAAPVETVAVLLCMTVVCVLKALWGVVACYLRR